MSWQLLTIISISTSALVVLLQRVLLHKDKSDPIAFVVVSQGITAVLLAIYAVVVGFHIPDLAKYWFPIVAMFGLYSGGHILYAHTLKRVEASIFSILFATKTIWVVFAGYFLFQEKPSFEHVVGTFIIIAGVGILAGRPSSLKVDRGLTMGLLTGLLFGLAAAAWVYVGKHTDAASWNTLTFAGTSFVVLFTNPRSVARMRPLISSRLVLKMLCLGVFWGASNIASLIAYQHGQVSIIAPLLQTSLILTVLLAIVFLKERTRLWQKALAATVCFLGIVLLIR